MKNNRLYPAVALAAALLPFTFVQAVRAQAVETKAVAPATAKKPNVLFIVVDDLFSYTGTFGSKNVPTPNIDRLAKHGVRFDRAYCQYPLCNPSRVSLLSGLRPDTTKIYDLVHNLTGVTHLPEYFGKNGYFTARVGKIEHGADQSSRAKIINWTEQETPPQGGNAPLVLRDFWDAQKVGLKPAWTQPKQIMEWRATDHKDEEESDGYTVRRIVQLMEKHKNEPYFLGAGLYRPHLPFTAPRKYFAPFPSEKIVLPSEFEPFNDRDDIPPVAFTHTPEAERLSDPEKRKMVAAYYACVAFMDAQVGVLLDEMDSKKLWDKTVVVFISDHGFHLDEHAGRNGTQGLWRKQTLFEEAARVPLIVAAPGVKGGVVSPRLVESIDLYQTLAALCGLPAPANLEGTSFAPLLRNPGQPWKKAAFSQVTRGQNMGRSVRTERYRYTEWGPDGKEGVELYDHQKDPREYTNLVSDPRHKAMLTEMRTLLHHGWQGALPPGVPVPVRAPDAEVPISTLAAKPTPAAKAVTGN